MRKAKKILRRGKQVASVSVGLWKVAAVLGVASVPTMITAWLASAKESALGIMIAASIVFCCFVVAGAALLRIVDDLIVFKRVRLLRCEMMAVERPNASSLCAITVRCVVKNLSKQTVWIKPDQTILILDNTPSGAHLARVENMELGPEQYGNIVLGTIVMAWDGRSLIHGTLSLGILYDYEDASTEDAFAYKAEIKSGVIVDPVAHLVSTPGVRTKHFKTGA